jgi:hypothetical protein
MQNQLLQKIKYVCLLIYRIKCVRNIMGVFKDANVRISFKTNSTINNDYKTVNSATNMKTMVITN